MSNYRIGMQKTKTGYKVVLFSMDNGKLVLTGESVKNREDAKKVCADIMNAWNDKRDDLTLELLLISASKKWPKNAGPKKKAASKRAVQTKTFLRPTKKSDGTGTTFTGGTGRRKPVKRATTKRK